MSMSVACQSVCMSVSVCKVERLARSAVECPWCVSQFVCQSVCAGWSILRSAVECPWCVSQFVCQSVCAGWSILRDQLLNVRGVSVSLYVSQFVLGGASCEISCWKAFVLRRLSCRKKQEQRCRVSLHWKCFVCRAFCNNG